MLSYKINNNIKFKIIEDNKFYSILTINERDYIIKKYKEWKNCLLFNGDCVKLNKIENNTLFFSKIEFFDFFITGIIPLYWNDFRKIAEEKNDKKLITILNKIEPFQPKNHTFSDIHNALNNNNLGNILAVSVLIKDNYNNYVITKRNNKVITSNNFYNVACTGSVDFSDLSYNNPILETIKREIKEELGLEILDKNIELKEIVYSENKLQPVILATAICQNNLFEIKENIIKHPEFLEENSNLFILHKKDIQEFIKNKNMSEISKYIFLLEIKD